MCDIAALCPYDVIQAQILFADHCAEYLKIPAISRKTGLRAHCGRHNINLWETLYMSNGLEIERKFLVEMPDVSALDVRRKISITQTYLTRGENDSQRRVRRISENGKVRYTYTEKVFLTPVTRKENEFEISEKEYNELLGQSDKKIAPVEKVRYCFDYNDQLFELDTYPFSGKLAIMELELGSPEQGIDFPANVRVLKDVSADAAYSNANLASAGRFPEQDQ